MVSKLNEETIHKSTTGIIGSNHQGNWGNGKWQTWH